MVSAGRLNVVGYDPPSTRPKDPTVLTFAPNVLAARLPRHWVMTAALVAGFTGLTILSADFAIPVPGSPVPITGQTFAVLLAGAALGSRHGALSQGLYLGLGAFGFHVFAQGRGGLATLLGSNVGYLLGFVVAAWVVGKLAERRSVDRTFSTMVTAFLAGSLVIYACGVVGLMLVAKLSLTESLTLGVYPFVVGDIIKATAAGVLLPSAWRLTGR